MIKKIGFTGGIAALLFASAITIIVNQGLSLLSAPENLRYLLDAIAFLFCCLSGGVSFGMFAAFAFNASTVAGLSGLSGLFRKAGKVAVAGAAVLATGVGGLAYLLLGLMHLSGLPLAFVVTVFSTYALFVGTFVFGIGASLLFGSRDIIRAVREEHDRTDR